jgi:nucleotide-binding universal stress UspA family protein
MSGARAPRRIVAGVDGSAGSLTALRWAAREAQLRGTDLHVVRAWEPAGKRTAPYASRAVLGGQEETQALMAARLEEAVRAVLGPEPPVAVTVEIAEGLAARVLIDRAETAELLVLGTAISPGLDAIGPVARACLRGASCPVVVVAADSPGIPVPA